MNKTRSHLHIFKKNNLIYSILKYVYIYNKSKFMGTRANNRIMSCDQDMLKFILLFHNLI
jgi:hypothetical protein